MNTMTRGKKPKVLRWIRPRLRFSLSTLAVTVSVIAVGLACWPNLKKKACVDVAEIAAEKIAIEWKRTAGISGPPEGMSLVPFTMVKSPMPYVVSVRHPDWGEGIVSKNTKLRKYYIWLFGYAIRIPFLATESPRGEVAPINI